MPKFCFKTKYVNQKDDSWFDFKVVPFEDQYMVVTDIFDMLDHSTGNMLLQRKGLPEALIIEAQRVYPNKIIISDTGGALWGAGSVVRERLVDTNLALYEEKTDRYVLKR